MTVEGSRRLGWVLAGALLLAAACGDIAVAGAPGEDTAGPAEDVGFDVWTPSEDVADPGGPVIVLRFGDVDETRLDGRLAELTARGLPLPPDGMVYVAWLVDPENEGYLNIGVLPLREDPSLVYDGVAAGAPILVALFREAKLSLEPAGDASTVTTPSDIRFRGERALEVWQHVRIIMADANSDTDPVVTTDSGGLTERAVRLAALVREAAGLSVTDAEAGGVDKARAAAERAHNLLVGRAAAVDLDGNGVAAFPEDVGLIAGITATTGFLERASANLDQAEAIAEGAGDGAFGTHVDPFWRALEATWASAEAVEPAAWAVVEAEADAPRKEAARALFAAAEELVARCAALHRAAQELMTLELVVYE